MRSLKEDFQKWADDFYNPIIDNGQVCKMCQNEITEQEVYFYNGLCFECYSYNVDERGFED